MAQLNIEDLANIFLSFESMTHKKLQKLCYYAQAWHLALLDKPLFNEKIEAWIHGPVIPDLYQKYKKYGYESIKKQSINLKEIDKELYSFIKNIYDYYGEFDGDQLENITHQEDPWMETRFGLDSDERSHREISKS